MRKRAKAVNVKTGEDEVTAIRGYSVSFNGINALNGVKAAAAALKGIYAAAQNDRSTQCEENPSTV